MRTTIAVAFVFALTCLPAAAQSQQNPVMEHYRAYRAAIDSGDLVAAETAAEQALAASDARDGDGGFTAVLAFNLATARLLVGEGANALAPAQRAAALAQSGAEGVDPRLARLVLARAQLAANEPGAAERLEQALADANALPAAEIHAAAVQLGVWAYEQRDYSRAEDAWAIAANHAAGSPLGEAYGLGYARMWQGASIMLDQVKSRGRRNMNIDRANEAYRLLADAQHTLAPFAAVDAPTLELTVPQQTYAQARAWLSVLRAKMSTDGQRYPTYAEPQGDGLAELGGGQQPRCWFRVNTEMLPEYPEEALLEGRLAGVVLGLRINEAGEIVDQRTVARIGHEIFAEAVELTAPRWTVARRNDSPPNCRMEATLLVPVSFTVAN